MTRWKKRIDVKSPKGTFVLVFDKYLVFLLGFQWGNSIQFIKNSIDLQETGAFKCILYCSVDCLCQNKPEIKQQINKFNNDNPHLSLNTHEIKMMWSRILSSLRDVTSQRAALTTACFRTCILKSVARQRRQESTTLFFSPLVSRSSLKVDLYYIRTYTGKYINFALLNHSQRCV